MLRIFIADDEQIVIDSLKFIVEKFVDGAEVVGYAKSGRETIEKVETLKPDVLLVDIKMPGIDGLEAIRRIKDRHDDMVFIIITAYENFGFAQEALKLGVLEYLLKPVNKDKVVEVIKKAGEVVEQNRRAFLAEIELKEKLAKVMPHLEGEFLYSLLFDGNCLKKLPFYEEIFEMPLRYGYVMVFAVRDDSEDKNNIRCSLDRFELGILFRDSAKDAVKCLVSPMMYDRVIAYVPVNKDLDEYSVRNESIKTANRIIDSLSNSIDMPYKIGIGSPHDIKNFLKSYEEADRAFKLSGEEKVFHYGDLSLPVDASDFYPFAREKQLLDKILLGDILGALEIFEEIFTWLTLNYACDIERIKARLTELLIVLLRFVSYRKETVFMGETANLDEFSKLNDITEIKLWFLKKIEDIISEVRVIRSREMGEVIERAIDYINENYAKDICMDDVARRVNISYHYFSKLFKDRTGQTFSII